MKKVMSYNVQSPIYLNGKEYWTSKYTFTNICDAQKYARKHAPSRIIREENGNSVCICAKY